MELQFGGDTKEQTHKTKSDQFCKFNFNQDSTYLKDIDSFFSFSDVVGFATVTSALRYYLCLRRQSLTQHRLKLRENLNKKVIIKFSFSQKATALHCPPLPMLDTEHWLGIHCNLRADCALLLSSNFSHYCYWPESSKGGYSRPLNPDAPQSQQIDVALEWVTPLISFHRAFDSVDHSTYNKIGLAWIFSTRSKRLRP